MSEGLLSYIFSIFSIKSIRCPAISFEISNKSCLDFCLVCFWSCFFRIFSAFNVLQYASLCQFDVRRSKDHCEYESNGFFDFETQTLYQIYVVTI